MSEVSVNSDKHSANIKHPSTVMLRHVAIVMVYRDIDISPLNILNIVF